MIRALHDQELATALGPIDESELLERACALIPERRSFGGSAQLLLSIAGGPVQQVLRPAEIEDPNLARDIQGEALLGAHPVLDTRQGTTVGVRGDALILEQPSASVLVSQVGSVCISQPARMENDRPGTGISALIEEDIAEKLARAIGFSAAVLDRIDPLRRVTDVVIVVALVGAGYMPWRSRAEQVASPNAAMMGLGGEESNIVLAPPRRNRQALTHDADRIVEDFVVLLRRGRTR